MKTLRNFVCTIGLFLTITASAAEKYVVKAQHGMASWYGTFHQGRVMANGQRFDKRKLTAASRVLPLGTRVLVTFKDRTIIVTVTDRGPYKHPHRIIDLSEAAARLVGLKPYGVGVVTVNPIFVETIQ